MALTQVFHYIITVGVDYGYLSSGTSQVFLYADLDSDNPDDKKTVYYQLCYPEEEEEEADQLDPSKSAVAQLTSFCLLALGPVALTGPALNDLKERAKKDLKRWSEHRYDGAKDYVDTLHNTQSTESQKTASQQSSQAKSDYVPSLGSESGDESDDESKGEGKQPVGRKDKDPTAVRRENDDDDDQENDKDGGNDPTKSPGDTDTKKRKRQSTSSNLQQSATMGSRFIRTKDYFEQQPSENLSQHYIALDDNNLEDKTGAIGTLFKVELAPYGYTFVGRGTTRSDINHLQHESRMYSRLEHLQGLEIPVYLGLIDLPGEFGYPLPGRFLIFHTMLMPWAGKRLARDVSRLELV
ncbi:hypothetical protein F4679DRAFT_592629 [Xylaria curta]|nr:hypothetical protein F4679DRAFT_592629 [Xylaria curta]